MSDTTENKAKCRLMSFFRSLFEHVFPPVVNIVANWKIKQKMVREQFDCDELNRLTNLPLDEMKEEHQKELARAGRIEDKAKTSAVGVSIAISLILGSQGMLSSLKAGGEHDTSISVAFIAYFCAVLFMLLAGVFALSLLTEKSMTYMIESDENKNDLNARAIMLNRYTNYIRGNYLSTSYGCIRNSLILLFVVSLLLFLPFKSEDLSNSSSVKGIFLYSHAAMQSIDSGISPDDVENLVQSRINAGVQMNQPITIHDDTQHLVVRFSTDGKTVSIIYADVYV